MHDHRDAAPREAYGRGPERPRRRSIMDTGPETRADISLGGRCRRSLGGRRNGALDEHRAKAYEHESDPVRRRAQGSAGPSNAMSATRP